MTAESPREPSPHALWKQANGDRDEYRRLMIEHGHLVPREPETAPRTAAEAIVRFMAFVERRRPELIDEFAASHGDDYALLMGLEQAAAEAERRLRDAEARAEDGLDVEVIRSYFRERGWAIHMDDRPDQPTDPFPELAAFLAAPAPESSRE